MENKLNFETIEITLLLSERSVQQLLDIVDQHPDWSIEKLIANHPKNTDGRRLFSYNDARIILKRLHLLTVTQRRLHHTFTKQLEDDKPQQSVATIFPDLLFYIKHRQVYLQQQKKEQAFSLTSAQQEKVRHFDKFFSLAGQFLLTFLASFIFFFIGSLIFDIIFKANTLLGRIGMFFAFSALFFGLFFFIYSLKYYFTIALILSFSRGGEKQTTRKSFWGWLSSLFGISIEIEEGKEIPRPQEKIPGISLRYDLANMQLERSPFVSIHVASFNETRVIDRFILAATSMEYENYEVVVADDSTDETVTLLEQWKKNPRVKISHRDTRKGFKGGALEEAMKQIDPRTEFILIFDADFLPYPDAVLQFLKYFQSVLGSLSPEAIKSANIAAVQGYQWHVLNKSENWITRGVRSEYAGSYVIERTGTEIYHGLKQISGSVYMIRRDLLDQLGWGTSITEDFELTLRLYEQGYKVVYTPYIQAPAEAVSTIKRLIRQRMRWAEGHSFNIKKTFWRLLVGHWETDGNSRKFMKSPLDWKEKLEFLYLAPYYLQAFFFILGTLFWFISEAILQTRLPFWTQVWGWSLVATNLFALPLMNMVGLFMEESNERDYLGLFSFIVLSYALAPFQAFAAIKGFLEKEEGPWFRTPKTGKITDTFLPGRVSRFFKGLFTGSPPAIEPGGAGTIPALTIPNQSLAFSYTASHLSTDRIIPQKRRGLATRLIVFLIMFSVLTTNFLPLFSLSPDSFPVVRHSDKEIQISAPKQDFSSKEHPRFSVRLDQSMRPGKTKQEQNLFARLFGTHTIYASEPEVTTRVFYKNTTASDIKTEVQENRDGSYAVVIDPGRFSTPGNYTLQTQTTRDGRAYTAYQDFSWGVLALNTKKSIYAPGELIDFGFGVVDSQGKTICDASLTLTITIPSEKTPVVLSSREETIIRSGKCGTNTVTNTPDYLATFRAKNIEETYKLQLEAITNEGKHCTTDTLTIKKDIPFVITRDSFPTRIFPPATYPIKMTVTTNEDFRGTITDTLPYSFEVTSVSQGGFSDHTSFVMPYSKTTPQAVSWNVDWHKGETHDLTYTLKFPHQSPEFYLVGPLTFKNNTRTVFQEGKQWQIAADANVQIRQEINILDSTFSIAGTGNSDEVVQLDTAQYSGTVTYYFESVVRSEAGNTGTVALRRKGTTTNDSSISVGTNTSYNRIRSSSFTPPDGATEYVATLVGDDTHTQDVKAARIIIMQNSAGITSTETQVEIGNYETGKTNNASLSALDSPKYWKYDSALWDGTQTFYSEVTYISSNSSANVTVTLQEDNGSFGSWTNKVTIVNGVASTTTARTRSEGFSPTTGRNYRIVSKETNNASSRSYDIYNAKIIIDQSLPDQSQTLNNTDAGFGTFTTDRYRGQGFIPSQANLAAIGFNLTDLGEGQGMKVYLDTADVNSIPTHAVGSELYSFTINISNLHTGYHIYQLPVAQTLNTGSQYCLYFAPWDTGNNSYSDDYRNFRWQNEDIYASGKAIINTDGTWIYSDFGNLDMQFATYYSNVTKLEAQYLLLNSATTSTDLRNYNTLYDPSEWSNVTSTYKYSHDAIGSAANSKLTMPTAITTDNFNRADSGNIGSDWTEVAGSWNITSNTLNLTSFSTTNQDAAGYDVATWDTALSTGTPDYAVEAVINAGGVVGAEAVVVRYIDGNNMYYASISTYNQGLTLIKIVGGVETQLGSTYLGGYSNNNNYTLRLAVIGNSLIVTEGGTVRITATDSSITAAGKPALKAESSNKTFDNFAVYADITNSSITGENQVISSALSNLPSSASEFDTYIIDEGTEIDASRILVQVGTAAVPENPILLFLLSPLLWFGVLKLRRGRITFRRDFRDT